MFKGIQDIMQKSEKFKSPKPEVEKPKPQEPEGPELWQVQPAAQLLSTPERIKYLEPLPDLLMLDINQYNELCKPVLRNIAEFCQDLPYTEEGFHSQKGGALDFALERTFHALSISRSYFLPTGSELVNLSYPQQLWAYAVFTASLLKDLGHLASQYKVQLYSKDKKPVGTWQPFAGAMSLQGEYYHFEFKEPESIEMKCKTTVLLSRHFLPTKGFEWLTSNPEVFQTWMALLEGDEIRSGTFGPVLMRAEAVAIKRFLADLQNINLNVEMGRGQLADFFSKLGTLKDVNSKNRFEALARAVHDFLHWMKDSIARDKLAIGSDDLKFSAKGLLLTDEMFKQFVKDSKGKYHNWKKIKEALTRFGIVHPGMEGKYMNTAKVIYHKAVILNNFHLTMPSSITPAVLRMLPALQSGFIKMPGSINQQNAVKYVSPDGQLVSRKSQETSVKLSQQAKAIEMRVNQRLAKQREKIPESPSSTTAPGSKA